jgi:KipI family sensor histidine kinase inhibitor
MELIPVGRTAVLAEVGDPSSALALAMWARKRIEADEVVPAATTVLFDGVDQTAVAEVLREWDGRTEAAAGELVEVPVSYDGPDLASLAESLGVTAEELVARHRAAEHVVAFCGFAPGFAYVLGSPFEVPRLATPRSRVAPGSVGLAGPYTGIYPTASPGGWQLIGQTDVVLWDPSREQPALLPPGTRIRFVPA